MDASGGLSSSQHGASGGESVMRWVALAFQIVIPGAIGSYLVMAMAMGLSAPPRARGDEIPLMILLGGPVIGFLAWLLGLIADRISMVRLVLTVALVTLGLTASYLLIELLIWARLPAVPLFLGLAIAGPPAGAM